MLSHHQNHQRRQHRGAQAQPSKQLIDFTYKERIVEKQCHVFVDITSPSLVFVFTRLIATRIAPRNKPSQSFFGLRGRYQDIYHYRSNSSIWHEYILAIPEAPFFWVQLCCITSGKWTFVKKRWQCCKKAFTLSNWPRQRPSVKRPETVSRDNWSSWHSGHRLALKSLKTTSMMTKKLVRGSPPKKRECPAVYKTQGITQSRQIQNLQ